MINRTRTLVRRYLSESIYKSLRYGYLAVYKRPGLTSAEELEELKDAIVTGMEVDKAVSEEKYLLRVGHGGNLDSMATGVLAVALCDGCKLLPFLLASSKRYMVTAQLGVATDTFNNKGKVVKESGYDHVTRASLEEALKEFVGEIWQKPPAYSALKIRGQRASDIVRSGGEVNLVTRPVVCHMARCVEFQPPHFTLDVSCGHGFYIRSLVHDLAQAVGSSGHVTTLVRTKHGPFTVEDCVRPEDYSLDSIVCAAAKARTKYPKLAQHLESYWEERHRKNNVQKKNSGYSKRTREDQNNVDSHLTTHTKKLQRPV